MTRSTRLAVLGTALFATVTLAAQPAGAYHTPQKPITDDTAYTLRQREIRLGLWKFQYGALDQLTVGTYLWPWIILAPNLHAKWRFWQADRLTMAFGTGVLYVHTEVVSWVEDQLGPAQVLAIPFELLGSYRFDDRFTLSLGPLWTLVRVKGTLDEDAYDGAAEGAGDNFQTHSTFEWRVSRVTALLLQGRFVFLQRESLSADVVSRPDDFTTIEARAVGDQAYFFSGAFSIAVDVALSWEVFNLRVGVGYGNYNIAAVNWVMPDKRFFPHLDLYWVWR